jgi:hypothetical protein
VDSGGVQRCSGELSARAFFGSNLSARVSDACGADQPADYHERAGDTDPDAEGLERGFA